jgi:hypothetical protein
MAEEGDLDLEVLSNDELRNGYFDALVARYQGHLTQGPFRVYRAILVEDAVAALDEIAQGRPLGVYWSDCLHCASSDYDTDSHPIDAREIVFVAEVPEDSIDWAETFRGNFEQPWERQVCITGPVRLVQVLDAARQPLADLDVEICCEGDWPPSHQFNR